MAISGASDAGILAFPGRQKGHIQIVDLHSCISLATLQDPAAAATTAAAVSPRLAPSAQRTRTQSRGSFSLDPAAAMLPAATATSPPAAAAAAVHPTNINIIAAHATAISALAVSADGTMVASASEKGTLIRIFDTMSGRLVHELRRGVDRADIYSIAFSPDNTRLCVSSDKGTVHIFNLDSKDPAAQQLLSKSAAPAPASASASASAAGNRQSNFKFMKDLLPKYFSSEWSFAHFRVANEVRCICGFGNERNSVIVLCADGTAQKYSFDSYRGNCVREWYRKFI
ncbi:Phosphatidylinositol 3,5-bisphosphate-binding protein [Kickxella alabastrina]|nr:Phosphatidylinositol 3,5-bisphosphate-binding protein [Kickxella alabastrina]